PLEAALKGSREIGFTVLSISLSLVAVFIPLLLMGGIIGRLFREFALTVTASIAVSALASLTLAPMLCSRFMHPETGQPGRIEREAVATVKGVRPGYRGALGVVLLYGVISLCVFFAPMAVTVFLTFQIPKASFPSRDTGLFWEFAEPGQIAPPQQMMR